MRSPGFATQMGSSIQPQLVTLTQCGIIGSLWLALKFSEFCVDHDTFLPGRDVLAVIDVTNMNSNGDYAEFEYIDRLGVPKDGFLVRWKDTFLAYENRCPHWNVPVITQGQLFHEGMPGWIICPLHGATFDVSTGECVSGPCVGDELEALVVNVAGDKAEVRARAPSLFKR